MYTFFKLIIVCPSTNPLSLRAIYLKYKSVYDHSRTVFYFNLSHARTKSNPKDLLRY